MTWSAPRSSAWLPPAGTPLGMLPEMEYPVTRVTLGPDDVLVVYTDGVTEATDSREAEFAESGLLEIVVTRAHTPPAVIIDAVVQAVHAHVGDGAAPAPDQPPPDAGDDLTLVVVKTV